MTSGNVRMGPDPDQTLRALREAIRQDPGMKDRSAEEVSEELVRLGYLEEAPDPVLVAEMLEGIQTGKLDREDGEETEEASPT